jgi:hypothetical protein
MSGGEIFYRRSSDNGSTWDITKRLSSGNGNNRFQCLTPGYSNNLYCVWQRKTGSSSYEVWYSKSANSGQSWSTPIVLDGNVQVSSLQSYGPMPVIAEAFINEQVMEQVVVFASSSGLKYTTSASGTSWSTPSTMSTPYSSRNWFPSLSPGDTYMFLTFDTRGCGVYSMKYNGSWSSYVQISTSGTIHDRYSCVDIDPDGQVLAAWAAQRSGDSRYRIMFRQGNSNNSWSSWFEEFDPLGSLSSSLPAITYYNKGGIQNYGIAIPYQVNDGSVRLKKYDNGTLWYDELISSSGNYPNISTEDFSSGVPKYI